VGEIEQRLATLSILPEFASLDIKKAHMHLSVLVSGYLINR
jgi:hypothetical protein